MKLESVVDVEIKPTLKPPFSHPKATPEAVKESKVKESKEDESKSILEDEFEKVWNLYDKKMEIKRNS